MTNATAIDKNARPTRCQCESPKPLMYPDGAILWCDGCGKILYIPIYLRVETIVTTAAS